MFQIIRNIFVIRELRNKVLFTLAILVIYRLGAAIPVPGIDLSIIKDLFQGGILGFLDLFSGGALARFAVFSLGIMPYITATIIMQLLQMVIPRLEEWAKEGETGRRKIQQIARYMTVGLALLQSTGMVFFFREAIVDHTWPYIFLIIVTLTSGTTLIMWLGELITQFGIGNGISLLIFTSIISEMPGAIIQMVRLGEINIFRIGLIGIIALAVVVGVIMIQQGERRITVQYAKQIRGRRVYGGRGTYIPLKVNQAGVIPVIFASSVLLFPAMIAQFFPGGLTQVIADMLSPAPGPGNVINPVYIGLYSVLIIIFTYFYSAVVFNPTDIADNFKKYGGFIPGIRPGRPTAGFLGKILNRITLPGSIFLASIAILPELFYGYMDVPFRFGGISLLIVVGVALETMKQLESQLLMRHYEGFFK
ncbi:preprotein translocase subunit SecY [Candidatus Hakubella thermalkaliphila]|uniref:Protein translocase subunit SecY n=1 Tax=Candidatus Hakubella thermalkaliphila TaxID=2754717 RepID=A0A6V8Q4E2_9ACTN|nr:preprotein translocase subunit SecY [Candidatus Hakubella thermalkaliphila]GFP37791.1 preprotein translocase subunit SecY [Candidatus Hakubella thermalkaliphila]